MWKEGKKMKKSEFYIPSTNKKNSLHVIMWKPEGEITAILQISHGMVEYIDRYDRFATYLAEKGILVVGNDHLGHGKSVNSDEELGYFDSNDGSKTIVEDLYELTKKMKQEYKNIPYFVMGHSMGSFMIRRYIMTYGNEVDGVIIMGTGQQPGLMIKLGSMMIAAMKAVKGTRYRSPFLTMLSFGGYNKKFEPARTKSDWLTKDEAIVDKYISDKFCSFMFTLNGYKAIFDTFSFIGNPKNIDQIPKELPILFASGAEDPVGECGRAVTKIHEIYIKHGIKQVELKLYPTDRHEILGELDYQTVFANLYEWMQKNIKKA